MWTAVVFFMLGLVGGLISTEAKNYKRWEMVVGITIGVSVVLFVTGLLLKIWM